MKLPILYRKRKYLSYSTLCGFRRCERKYLLDGGFGLSSPTPHPALLFGSAMHNAIAHWHLEFSADQMLRGFDDVWDENLADDKGRCTARAYQILQHYAATHMPGKGLYELVRPPEDKGFIKLPGSLSPFEVAFVMDIGLEVPIVGKIDALARHRQTGELVVMEWKTGNQVGPMLQSAFNLNNQINLYQAASAVHGLPVKRAFVELIQVCKTKEENVLLPKDILPHMTDCTLRWFKKWGRILLETEKRFLDSGEDVEMFEQDYSGCHPYSLFGMAGFACPHVLICGVPDPKNLLGMYAIKEERAFPLTKERGQ